MPGTTPPSHDSPVLIPDEIVAWMESGTAVPAEFIIQADLPRRSVAVIERATGRRDFSDVSGNTVERMERLMALAAAVRRTILTEASVLKAAGAIAVSALPEELRRISQLPGIREIRFNRKRR